MEHALFAAEAAFFFGTVTAGKRTNAAPPKQLLKSPSSFACFERAANTAQVDTGSSSRTSSSLG